MKHAHALGRFQVFPAAITVQSACFGQAALSPSAALNDQGRVSHWHEDINSLVRELPKRHKNAFFQTSQEQFEQSAAGLKARVPELTDAQIVIGISGVVALLGDGHTMVALDYARWNLRPYPVFSRVCSDGVFILQTTADRADLLGLQIMAIDDVPVDQVIDRLSKVISHDNEWALKNALVNWLCLAEALNAVGVVSDMDHARFRLRDAQGAERVVELAPLPVPLSKAGTLSMKSLPATAPDQLPLSIQRRPAPNWFEAIPDSRAMYIRYDRCADDKNRSVKDFSEEALAALQASEIQTVVVDLRRNGGGNSALLRPLIQGLAKWRTETNESIAVLIGRNTFSSAVMNAVELRRDAGAVLYGEPTGGKPNHYGETKTFELPNSKIAIQYSTKFFKMQDEDTPGVMPDVRIDLTSADIINAHDTIMDAALSHHAASQ